MEYEKVGGLIFEKKEAVNITLKLEALADTIKHLENQLNDAKAEKAELEALK